MWLLDLNLGPPAPRTVFISKYRQMQMETDVNNADPHWTASQDKPRAGTWRKTGRRNEELTLQHKMLRQGHHYHALLFTYNSLKNQFGVFSDVLWLLTLSSLKNTSVRIVCAKQR